MGYGRGNGKGREDRREKTREGSLDRWRQWATEVMGEWRGGKAGRENEGGRMAVGRHERGILNGDKGRKQVRE